MVRRKLQENKTNMTVGVCPNPHIWQQAGNCNQKRHQPDEQEVDQRQWPLCSQRYTRTVLIHERNKERGIQRAVPCRKPITASFCQPRALVSESTIPESSPLTIPSPPTSLTCHCFPARQQLLALFPRLYFHLTSLRLRYTLTCHRHRHHFSPIPYLVCELFLLTDLILSGFRVSLSLTLPEYIRIASPFPHSPCALLSAWPGQTPSRSHT